MLGPAAPTSAKSFGGQASARTLRQAQDDMPFDLVSNETKDDIPFKRPLPSATIIVRPLGKPIKSSKKGKATPSQGGNPSQPHRKRP